MSAVVLLPLVTLFFEVLIIKQQGSSHEEALIDGSRALEPGAVLPTLPRLDGWELAVEVVRVGDHGLDAARRLLDELRAVVELLTAYAVLDLEVDRLAGLAGAACAPLDAALADAQPAEGVLALELDLVERHAAGLVVLLLDLVVDVEGHVAAAPGGDDSSNASAFVRVIVLEELDDHLGPVEAHTRALALPVQPHEHLVLPTGPGHEHPTHRLVGKVVHVDVERPLVASHALPLAAARLLFGPELGRDHVEAGPVSGQLAVLGRLVDRVFVLDLAPGDHFRPAHLLLHEDRVEIIHLLDPGPGVNGDLHHLDATAHIAAHRLSAVVDHLGLRRHALLLVAVLIGLCLHLVAALRIGVHALILKALIVGLVVIGHGSLLNLDI